MLNKFSLWLARKKSEDALSFFETAKTKIQKAQDFMDNVVQSIETSIRNNKVQMNMLMAENDAHYGDISTVREEQQRLERVKEKITDILGD